MDRSPSRSRPAMAMSLEASLDQENREVLAALDASPPSKASRTSTPPPPVRSMLDVGSPTPRHGSIAGIGVGITRPTQASKTTLDPSDPTTYTSPHSSKSSSPTLSKSSPVVTRQRESSGSDKPAAYVGLPKIQYDDKRGFEHEYNFDMSSIPSSVGASTRSIPQGKRPREGSTVAMAAAMSGDWSPLEVGMSGGHTGRHNSTGAVGSSHSLSPSSRIRKPGPSTPGFLSPSSPPPKYVTGSGTIVDDTAHRRLSDKSTSFSTVADDSEEGTGRVPKDEVEEEDAVAESSEEEHSSSSDEDETRGRHLRRRKASEGEELTTIELTKASEQGEAKSQMAAAEEERIAVSTSQAVKSLLEPSISVTGPTGEKIEKKAVVEVRPSSNFAMSRSRSPALSQNEDGDTDAIKKAKSLSLNISPLDDRVPDRHVRIILRGNWAKFHDEAEASQRTPKLYLCCTDLSTEASYAMEWTVGTILRDGDTLLAIYAIEDETAGKASEADREVLQAEGAQAGKDAHEVMDTLTRQTTQGGGSSAGLTAANKYVPATEAQSLTGSVDAKKVSKKEMERLRAIEEVTQNFLRLVRKTTLQVRCMIEVIHCKSPKHLILGAVSRRHHHHLRGISRPVTDTSVPQIDELEPTLCVVGTRGRSSLKGVLLGSFSNYLVTKSSVPVMVARKKLKKPRSQARISSNKIRLTNNLTASNIPVKRRTLTQARID